MDNYNSVNWQPKNENCGVRAWLNPQEIIAPISPQNMAQYQNDASYYARCVIQSYNDRRIFEDAIGRLKWAARMSDGKAWYSVIEIANILLETGDPVKMNAAYGILEWFIIGQMENATNSPNNAPMSDFSALCG